MSSKVYRAGEQIDAAPAVWRAIGQAPRTAATVGSGDDALIQAAYQRGLQEGRVTGETAASQKAMSQLTPVLKNLGAVVQDLAGARQRFQDQAEEATVA